TGILPVDETGIPRGEGIPPSNRRQDARDMGVLANHRQDADATDGFDLVVVGGGMAGCCTAVAAARLGLQVALIQDRPVLGGNNSSEPRVHLGGEINLPPYPRIGDIVRELDGGHQGNARPAEFYGDDKKLAVVKAEPNITLFLNMHANKVEMQANRIIAVTAANIRTGEELRFEAPLFADCTGDGTIGFLAGADFRMGREGRDQTGESMAPEIGDSMTMGASAMWYSTDDGAPSAFPECPWALQFTDETCQHATRGEWNWECGLSWNQIDAFEAVRDHALRAVYGNWAFQKNHAADKARYANLRLDWVAHIAGKRESRRLLGDVILTQQDIEGRTRFADAIVTTTWSIDLHYPDPVNSEQFPGMEFRTICTQPAIKPYPIPYRCLYSRNIENLFMAGRNISVTHVALGTVRVMRTTGMMGEAAGMAAAIAARNNTTPRGVFQNHLPELLTLAKKGVGKETQN
ncbi:MAG TPA: FAD-dependent oxidoreductase, partial [Phycisphaerales bacterium]|nr:FAD-dependent oxidoreductase [Phycisphaerales bacterium]